MIQDGVMYMNPNNFELSGGNPKWVEKTIVDGIEMEQLVEGIPIDKNIAESISKLNKLGYRTKFCCEGHYNDTQAYIVFDPSVPLAKIYNLLATTDMWELDKQTYRNSSTIQIEPKLNLVNLSNINRESEENRIGYEYLKRVYLDNLKMGVYALENYDFIDIGLRPIVSEVNMTEEFVYFSGSFYLHNDSIEKLTEIQIGDKAGIPLIDSDGKVVENGYYLVEVIGIEINMQESVKITCKVPNCSISKFSGLKCSLHSIKDLHKHFYNKPMYFERLGDF